MPAPAIQRLYITDLRNLREIRLNDLARINVVWGDNGSGKTSMLEAIHILGSGRSFRGSPPKSLIRYGQSHFTVFAVLAGGEGLSPIQMGVQRNQAGELQVKLAGSVQRNLSQLAHALPVQLIDASAFDLLVGSPAVRRQFLNWGVFHVEHRFHGNWLEFQRAIKQRNSLLRRDTIRSSELAVWDRRVAEAGEAINADRLAYFDALAPLFRDVLARLVPELGDLEIRFRRGWDRNLPYLPALQAAHVSDRERGFTQSGPHRADLRITLEGRNAAEVLSRGQQKLVVIALKLAQGALLFQRTGRHCVYLVDDLPAELDGRHLQRVCVELDGLGAQVFLTTVDPSTLPGQWAGCEHPAMFHVEHGALQEPARSDINWAITDSRKE